jgi:hypothetical protein
VYLEGLVETRYHLDLVGLEFLGFLVDLGFPVDLVGKKYRLDLVGPGFLGFLEYLENQQMA